MSFNFAYLSGGRLYLKLGQANVQNIISEFGQAVQQRESQTQRRNGWKQKNTTANLMSAGILPDAKQDRSSSAEASPTNISIAVQGVCPTSADRLLYTLAAGEVGGIFTLERFAATAHLDATAAVEPLLRTKEKRLFHSADFKVDRVDFHPEYQLIACAAIGDGHFFRVRPLR